MIQFILISIQRSYFVTYDYSPHLLSSLQKLQLLQVDVSGRALQRPAMNQVDLIHIQ